MFKADSIQLNKIKVCSAQFNYKYNGRIHFPFSISLLVSHIKTRKDLEPYFDFQKSFIFRNKLEEYVEKAKDCDILLCSCYVWNWEITITLAEKIKKINPDCKIIFGGPQVPNRSEGFFQKYPFVDILVHGEGEMVLENVFRAILNKNKLEAIKGIETKDFRTEPEPRIKDVSVLASPYTSNVIWDLIDREDSEKWAVSWETVRGCPYQCTFCDWGSATGTLTRQFPEERLYREIEWFAENKFPYIECCDANFGIFIKRDHDIAKKLQYTANKTGYPKFWRSAWAKFSSEKIIPIAKTLQDADLLQTVTLSLQSLDEETLDIIKRENIKFEKFSDLVASFRKNQIPTYTELIRGLPGETLESFKKGLETLIANTEAQTIYVYNCGVFVNAPMAEPAYMNFNKIKTIRSPIYLAHSSIHEREIDEYEDIVISTASFSLDELKQMYYFSWAMLTFHGFGILEYIAKYYFKMHNLSFMKFFEIILKFSEMENSIFHNEFDTVKEYINKGYSGKGWNHYDSELGDIFWPIEEASFLRFVKNEDILKEDIGKLVEFLEQEIGAKTDKKIKDSLINFQLFLITTRKKMDDINTQDFSYNWKEFFVNNSKLDENSVRYYYKNLVLEQDEIAWNYKTIWYGRSTKQYKVLPEHLETEPIVTKKFIMSLPKQNPSP